jgi:hypothetical protein
VNSFSFKFLIFLRILGYREVSRTSATCSKKTGISRNSPIAAESESDLRLDNPTKATILSFRELEKTKRRNIIYFRQITTKIWKETHQRDQVSNMTRPQREFLSLCETEAAPTCQSSFVNAAVLRLRGGGDSVDTAANLEGDPKQSSTSPSLLSLQELFNPANFVGRKVAEVKTYANLISPTNACIH